MNKIELSIVIPVYKCSSCLKMLYKEINDNLKDISNNFEIILVNDSSPDNSWEVVLELSKSDKRVKGINLSKNFGQHYAITAGLDYAQGDWVVVMDCDLQDLPSEIPNLYRKVKEGYDFVLAKRKNRKDNYLKKLSSKLFSKVFQYFTETEYDNTVANFGIYSKNVIENVLKFREQNRSFPLFVKLVGFKYTKIFVEHGKRYSGKTSYNFKKLMKFASDSIISHSNKPLKVSIFIGFLMSFISLFFAGYLVYRYLFFSIPVAGWTSVIVSIYFVGGLLFANMGILGLYIGKIFNETKNRPLYIIKEKTWE